MNLNRLLKIILLHTLLTNMSISRADVCKIWSQEKKLGSLDTSIIPEASGIVISEVYSNRLYHINDSGNKTILYQTNKRGKKINKINVLGFNSVDLEDLSYGNCGKDKCLVIADIGDNRENRDFIKLAFIFEKDLKGRGDRSVRPRKIITLSYPDKSHNSESLAMHPNGDIFIITKEKVKKKRIDTNSHIYKLRKEDYLSNKGEIITLDYLGFIKIPYLKRKSFKKGRAITSFDISSNGKNLILLTYNSAVEISLDLSLGIIPKLKTLERGIDINLIEIKKLKQQEAISYLPRERAFIYSTEKKQSSNESPIYGYKCLK